MRPGKVGQRGWEEPMTPGNFVRRPTGAQSVRRSIGAWRHAPPALTDQANFVICNQATLLLGSGVFCNEQLNERAQQCFASPAHVVHAREKAEGERQFCLGDAPMRTQPTAQQRPTAFHRVDMHCTKPVAIFIARLFAPAMIDVLMRIAPSLKTSINAVLVCVNQGILSQILCRRC